CFVQVMHTLLEKRNDRRGGSPAKDSGNGFAWDCTEVLSVPQRDTFFHGTFECGSFCPVAIENFTFVINGPPWLIFFCPEAEVESVQDKDPVDSAFCAIVEVIAVIPQCGRWYCILCPRLHCFYPLPTELVYLFWIDPDMFALLYHVACAA